MSKADEYLNAIYASASPQMRAFIERNRSRLASAVMSNPSTDPTAMRLVKAIRETSADYDRRGLLFPAPATLEDLVKVDDGTLGWAQPGSILIFREGTNIPGYNQGRIAWDYWDEVGKRMSRAGYPGYIESINEAVYTFVPEFDDASALTAHQGAPSRTLRGNPQHTTSVRGNPDVEVSGVMVTDYQPLPEAPERYFKLHMPGTQMVPLDKLIAIRAREKGVRNANKFMHMAYNGQMETRKPISLRDNMDGTFTVLDGNSTFANAKASGWSSIPGIVVDQATDRNNLTVNPYRHPYLQNPGRRRNGINAVIDPTAEQWQTSPITREHYPGIFGNYDGDPFLNVDDPHPMQSGDTMSIEEVRLSDELGNLIDMREQFDQSRVAVLDVLDQIGGQVGGHTKSRTKTPFSMVQKARKKFLPTLTDMAGTMLIVPDARAAEASRDAILNYFSGVSPQEAMIELGQPQYNGKPPYHAVGGVVEYENKYLKPQGGYRAHHFLINLGTPEHPRIVEVQLKTERMYHISDAGHTPYKRGVQDATMMERLTSLAHAADQGDREAAAEIDPIIAKGRDYLERLLTVPSAR